jgi:hypothetical protein
VTVVGYPRNPDPSAEWTGAKRHYDLITEATVALVAVSLLTVLLAALFSSPDEKPVTVSSWAAAAPRDFLATALSELDGTSGVAAYGPPYTHIPGAGQNIIGHLSIERFLGVHSEPRLSTIAAQGPPASSAGRQRSARRSDEHSSATARSCARSGEGRTGRFRS